MTRRGRLFNLAIRVVCDYTIFVYDLRYASIQGDLANKDQTANPVSTVRVKSALVDDSVALCLYGLK